MRVSTFRSATRAITVSIGVSRWGGTPRIQPISDLHPPSELTTEESNRCVSRLSIPVPLSRTPEHQ